VVLLLRMLASCLARAEPASRISSPIAGPFAVAFLVGPAGLTVAAYFWAHPDFLANRTFAALFWDMLKWGLAPRWCGFYISYYLDRQTLRRPARYRPFDPHDRLAPAELLRLRVLHPPV